MIKTLESDLTSKNPLMNCFSQYETRAMAASHVICAKKPLDYNLKITSNVNNNELIKKRRDYYSLRYEVMLAHHELGFYSRLVLVIDKNLNTVIPKLPNLNLILSKCNLTDPFNINQINKVNQTLKSEAEKMFNLRDKVINIYNSIHSVKKGKKLYIKHLIKNVLLKARFIKIID